MTMRIVVAVLLIEPGVTTLTDAVEDAAESVAVLVATTTDRVPVDWVVKKLALMVSEVAGAVVEVAALAVALVV